MSDPAYADQIAYFTTIPWVSATLREPGLISMPPITRHFDPALRASEFWGVTLHSKATIPYFIGCFHPPPSSPPAPDSALGDRYIAHVRFFLKLSHGLSTLERERVHGGVVASIFDECAGAVGHQRRRRAEHLGIHPTQLLPPGNPVLEPFDEILIRHRGL
ncbi:hypothetical protein K4K59_012564 [Colletotrichum sp. SAR11_240]|nr:hypothetical protein K4K59_012564 [Colletotrichum sp. SAR11_240]